MACKKKKKKQPQVFERARKNLMNTAGFAVDVAVANATISTAKGLM